MRGREVITCPRELLHAHVILNTFAREVITCARDSYYVRT